MVMGFASCTSWREAKAVIAEADRLLGEGVIMQDTLALAEMVDALDNPIGRVIAKEKLAKAYYLMGRNMDDYHHHYADAADFYIQADRLNTRDNILRGRINSCMGFICKQDSCFEEALVFYERANIAFAKTDNQKRYANGLLSIAEQYVNLKEYNKADSILQIANNYDIDSAYYARIMDIQALSCFNQKQYDLALMYLLTVKNYPRLIEARCYSYMMIMRSYNKLQEYTLATTYAQYIIQHSNNHNYRLNAYFHLIDHA